MRQIQRNKGPASNPAHTGVFRKEAHTESPTNRCPLRYSKRIVFDCTIPLPSRPAKQRKAPKPITRVNKPTRVKKPPRTPTPLELQERIQKRLEYENSRNQRPERKQFHRDSQKRQRQRKKELGRCKTCPQPIIPGQTRCPSCAAKHRQSHKNATATRQAARTAAQQSKSGTSSPPSSGQA